MRGVSALYSALRQTQRKHCPCPQNIYSLAGVGGGVKEHGDSNKIIINRIVK